MIRLLIVEDSPVKQQLLKNILESDPEIQVVEMVNDGEKAIEAVKKHRPDVVTMDINMPNLNGFDATRQIMESVPTPIVVVSGEWDTKKVETALRAMEAGALACVATPPGIGHVDHRLLAEELICTVKAMSEVKVIRRWPRLQKKESGSIAKEICRKEAGRITDREIKVVAVGASVGGPVALQTILSSLSCNFPVPVVIVQHIAAGFASGLVEWLSLSSALPVKLARQGEKIISGHVYLAPDDFQLRLQKGDTISLTKDEPAEGLRPAVSVLFRSVAEVYGKDAIGVLLTGMGRDGAAELKMMKDQGAITIAQNEETSVVFGMPGEAVKMGGALYVLPLTEIGPTLQKMLNGLMKGN